MYKINLGRFNAEKAASKQLKFVTFPQQHSAIFWVDCDLKKFAKSIDASTSDLFKLTQQEVDGVNEILRTAENTPQQQPLVTQPAQAQQKAETASLKRQPAQTQQKTETASPKMSDFKVHFKAPKIDLSSDDAVENSIRALRATNDMKLMTEQQLIYSALIESDCMHLFAVLTTAQRTSVAAFCNYILQAYGSSINHYSRFEKMHQESNENFENFLSRVKQLYAALSGKSIVNFDENDKKIVVSKFVEAVYNKTVTSELTKIYSTLSLDTVAASAKNITTAIKKTSALEVNAVNNFERNYRHRSSSRDRHRSSSRDRNYRNRSSSRDRNYRNRSSSRDRKKVSWSNDMCFRCGLQGHYAQQCQASWKTVRDFRRKLDSNHQ